MLEQQRAFARASLLWRHRGFVGRALLAGLILFALICCLLPRRYESTSTLMPTFRVPEIAILQSRTVQDALIAKFHLQNVYRDRAIEDAREDLQKHTAISENARSEIVTVVVRDRNAGRAAAMDREYADQLNLVVIAMRQESARSDRVYLQQELSRTTAELNAAESRTGDYSSKSMIVDGADQLRTIIHSEARLNEAINRRQAELQSLKVAYTDDSPVVRVTEAQISELKKELNAFAGRQVPAATDGPTVGLSASLRDIPFLAARYEDLHRVAESKEEIAGNLNERYQSALLREKSDVPPVAVLDQPSVSLLRPWPLYSAIVFLGTFLSIFVASSYVIAVSEISQPVENISGMSQPPESAVTQPEGAMTEPAVPVPVETH